MGSDDPQELARVVRTRGEFVQAETALWNPRKKAGIRKRSIAEVCAFNVHGVPPNGAPRCLRWCLEEHGDAVPQDVRARIAAKTRHEEIRRIVLSQLQTQ